MRKTNGGSLINTNPIGAGCSDILPNNDGILPDGDGCSPDPYPTDV